jgi:hypothetical protein
LLPLVRFAETTRTGVPVGPPPPTDDAVDEPVAELDDVLCAPPTLDADTLVLDELPWAPPALDVDTLVPDVVPAPPPPE